MSTIDSNFQQVITGSITSVSQSIDLSSPNSTTEIIQLTGTWVGTLIIEGSNNGSTYYSITTLNQVTGLVVSSITSSGLYIAATNGFQFLRIRSSLWTSGTATINAYGSDSSSLNTNIDLIRGGTDGTVIGNTGNALNVSATVAPSTDLIGSGTIAALNATVAVNTQGRSTITFGISGTWIATLNLEATIDSTNWFAIESFRVGDELEVSSTTAVGNFVVSCGGYAQIRVRASLYTSGTATIAYDSSIGQNLHDPTYANTGTAVPRQLQLVGGSDGINIYPLAIDNQGRLITSALTGYGADFVFSSVSTAALTRVLVNQTAYTEQTSQAQRSIASSSASDTAAGVGARTVKIEYLDTTGTPFTEIITLNGTSYVNTVATNIHYIEHITVMSAGTSSANVGILTLKAATAGGGATIGTVSVGDNQSIWGHHYVPTGKICNITGISCGHNGTTVGSGALFTINASTLNAGNLVETQVSDFVRLYGQTSTFSRNYSSPVKVTGPARLRLWITPETSSAVIYRAAFDFFEP